MLGHVAMQVVYVQRRCYVGTPVGAQHAVALCQERISHQGADQSSQAYEEMQGLWQDTHVELETVVSNSCILPEKTLDNGLVYDPLLRLACVFIQYMHHTFL